MREFVDERGRSWDVVVGRESWGSLFALFIPRRGSASAIRQCLLDAASLDEANRVVERLDTDQLKDLFQRSESKGMG